MKLLLSWKIFVTNVFEAFVETDLLKGGLNHIMFGIRVYRFSDVLFVYFKSTLSPEQQYKKLLHENAKKHNKKAPLTLETSINLEAKIILELIILDDRVECIARTPAVITLKDHKPDFQQNPSC